MGKNALYAALISIFIAAVLLVAWKFEGGRKRDDYIEKYKKSFIFGAEVKAEDIVELNIDNPYGKFAFKKKEDGKWQMTAPVDTPASSMTMELMLTSIEETRLTDIVDEGKGITDRELEMYRLKEPDITVSFKTGGPKGKTYPFQLGRRSPVESAVYMRRVDTGQILKATSTFKYNFNGTLTVYRDRKIFKFDPNNVKLLDITLNNKHYLLKKEGEGGKIWIIKEPLNNIRGSIYKIGNIVSDLSTWHVLAYLDEEPKPEHGFDKPFAVIKVGTEIDGSEPETVIFGAKVPGMPDKNYLLIGRNNQVGILYTDALETPRENFKDLVALKALTFKRDAVNSLEINGPGGLRVMAKRSEDKVWSAVDSKIGEVDDVVLETIIHKAWRLKIAEIIGEKGKVDMAKAGLDNPSYTIKISFSTDKAPLSLYLGKIVQDTQDTIYAMNNEDDYVFIVRGDILGALPDKISDILQ